ncbi:MAG: hypothetical protein LBD01_00370, partial [Puniceicoccales bacterium]|nr:hypothetical protein [Puniceicoccales bacterium]
ESVHATIENEFFDLENFSGRAHFIAATGTYLHFYNFVRKNRSRAKKTPVELLREKAPNLHPHILLLHPCLLDSHMGQLLSRPPEKCIAPAFWRDTQFSRQSLGSRFFGQKA